MNVHARELWKHTIYFYSIDTFFLFYKFQLNKNKSVKSSFKSSFLNRVVGRIDLLILICYL